MLNALILILILGSLVFLLLTDLGNEKSEVFKALTNFGHFPLFGILALALLWILNNSKWPVLNPNLYAISFVIAVALGIATEYLQMLTPDRYFETKDIFHNIVGAFTFLVFAYPSSTFSGKKIMAAKIVSICILVSATFPIFSSVMDAWHMDRDFPLLGSFETRLEMKRWTSNTSEIKRSYKHPAHGSFSLEAHLLPGQYPGISQEHVSGNWSGYDVFAFHVYLEGSSALPVVVRIHDNYHDQTYDDRYNRTFLLKPGENDVIIALDDVRKAPRMRLMDMTRIANICIFSHNLEESRVLYLDYFRLEKVDH